MSTGERHRNLVKIVRSGALECAEPSFIPSFFEIKELAGA
jgi:hypothetical protein